MKKLLIFLTLGITLLFAQNYDYAKTKNLGLYKADINAMQAYEMQKKGVLLVDVRTKREYAFSHPKDAVLVPVFFEKNGQRVYNNNFIEQVEYALGGDSDKPIMLICRSGSRTKYAANILADNGFGNVYNVVYGFATKGGWLDSRLPIQK